MNIDLASSCSNGHSACPCRDAPHAQLEKSSEAAYEIRFQSLFREGHAMTFPCNRLGQVDCDALPERAKNNYFFARAMVGREFAVPAVQPCTARAGGPAWRSHAAGRPGRRARRTRAAGFATRARTLPSPASRS